MIIGSSTQHWLLRMLIESPTRRSQRHGGVAGARLPESNPSARTAHPKALRSQIISTQRRPRPLRPRAAAPAARPVEFTKLISRAQAPRVRPWRGPARRRVAPPRRGAATPEHVQYFPFGETWVSEQSNAERLPYLFTSKELDEETALYYFGARYYDPRTSVWQSTDSRRPF